MPKTSGRRRTPSPNQASTEAVLSSKSSSRFRSSAGHRWLSGLLVALTAASTVILVFLLITPYPDPEQPSKIEGLAAEDDPVAAVKQKLSSSKSSIAKRPISVPLAERAYNNEIEQTDLLERLEIARLRFAEDPVIHRIAGTTYTELQLTEQATQCFERSLELNPNATETAVEYAALQSKAGNPDLAIERLSKLKDAPDASTGLFHALGEAMMQKGDIEQAIPTLEKGLERFPKEPKLLSLLAQAQNQSGDFVSAELNAKQALEIGGSNDQLVMALSTALLRQGKREEGLAVRQKHSQKPDSPAANDDELYRQSFAKFASHTYGLLANVYESHGELDTAEKWRVFGLQLNPGNTRILVSLGEMLRKSQRINEAIPIYQRLIALEPDNTAHYNNLASFALAKQDIRLALNALEQGANRDRTGYLSLQTARIAFEVGDGARAERYAADAAEKLKSPDAYLLWLAVLRGLQKNQAASNTLTTAKALFPNDPRFQQLP
jgi:tetratricopeptide (TPR) repeat protein